ncbi:MAG: DUF4168 domain-containing protein [Kiloniellaceae bacterium]
MLHFISLVRRLAVLAVPVAVAAGAVPAGAVAGQAANALPGAGGQLAQAEIGGFSQAKLESYAAAVNNVQRVDDAWQPKLSQAETAEEIESMTRQATDEMIGEIEGQGLTVEEYNSITQAAEQNDLLYDHIMTLLAEARQ